MESIVNQTLKDIEIICVDDGSTDNSGKILDEYAQKDNRIKVIHKENGGYGKAMNIGLDNATGEYIGIVEPDDYVALDMYEKQYSLAKNYNLDFVKADFNIFIGNDDSRTFTYRKMSDNPKYYNIVLTPSKNIDIYNTNNVIWTGIYNKEFLQKNNIRFNTTPGASYQDNGFYFQTYTLAKKMWIMPEPFYNLRRDNPNSSINSKAKVFCICEEYDFIENILKQQPNLSNDVWQMFYIKKFANYMWTFNRVAEIYKYDFLKRFANDFQNIEEKYLNNNLFGNSNYKELKKIIASPEKYYKKIVDDRRNKYKLEIEDWFKEITKKSLNLKNPKTFNEKIQWLKLYDSTPLKTQLADKYLVRDWVKEKIGEEYLIPLLGVYDNFDEIDFDKLPNQFVIKCNHGCGYNIIVTDKSTLDKNEAKEKITKWMNEDFAFKNGLELHYSNIQRKIIIEEYIENANGDLYDYKFWCFNGNVEYIQFLSERNTNGLKMAFYDKNWNKQNFVYSYPLDEKNIEKPNNLETMIELAEKLSKDFQHVRVDFYRLNNGKIYFGEMTFTSCSGTCKWAEKERLIDGCTNGYLGEKIELPKLAYDIHTDEYYELKFSWKDNLHKIFSIRKNLQRTHKIITILGLQFRIKRKQKK